MKKLLLTTVAVTAFATGASAMEAGKMYMRADLGYNMSSPSLKEKIAKGKDDTSAFLQKTKKSNRLKGFAGDIGFGYALSDSIRTDLTLNLSQGKKTLKDVELSYGVGDVANDVKAKDGKYDSANGEIQKSKVKLKEKKLGLMANAYYDFHNSSEFTPYVMAGVGLNRGSLEAKIDGYKTGTDGKDLESASATIKSKNLTSFAYQVGVGVGYEMSKDIHLDLGYKLSGMTGTYKFKTNSDGSKTDPDLSGVNPKNDKFGSPKLQHTISAGVRFAF